ncbi:hypothetical protein LLG46_12760 [bacterium]|nr:hypothetical protein [bacterium]
MEKIDLQGQPLDLDLTMTCGQAFRWHKRGGVWSGVVKDKLMELDIKDGSLLWRTYPHSDRPLVEEYLRLNDDVNAIYAELGKSDPHLAELTERFHGLRLLRQDPTEALFSFVCSAANNIPRIMGAVETLAVTYGELVCELGGSCYYAFPTPEAIASADPAALHNNKALGFRGRLVRNVALEIVKRGSGWLSSLREASYADDKQVLLELPGVGPKIADCVCLFSLDKDEAVPVDTHVRQLAHRLFLPDLKARTITDNVYRCISCTFGSRYGKYAGWAQQFLYYEDLMKTNERSNLSSTL